MDIESSSQQSHHLPEAIIEEVLSRLPVQSLLRLRCVSKSWGSLIGCERFIKTHHQNSIKNPSFPHQRVFIRKYGIDIFSISEMFHRPGHEQCSMCDISHDFSLWPRQCSLLSVLSEPMNTIPLSPFVDPTNPTLSKGYQILGCCNGLLCVLDTHNRIHLWNPSTRISKKLPKISKYAEVKNLGFGWVESSGEYKVFVRVETNDRKLAGKVYSSKKKSWKTIEFCYDLDECSPSGLFASGKLYWKVGCFITSLDLKSEVFDRIEFPLDEFCFKKRYRLLGVVGGCVCVLYYNIFFRERVARVWVMKEAWEKVATLSDLVELAQPPLVRLKGKILVDCGSALLVYNPRDNVFRLPQICVVDYFDSRIYVESLVSPEDL